MNASTVNSTPSLRPAILIEFENCNPESVFAPGSIQPHGVLLTLEEPTLKILQISENVEQFWGLPATALLGQPLQTLFPAAQVNHIQACLDLDSLEYGQALELTPYPGATQTPPSQLCPLFRSTLYRTPDSLILELEPVVQPQPSSILQTYQHLQSVILKLRSAATVLDLVDLLATEIKTITGFDRVMVYRFESDDHGFVIAEGKAAHLESFLGLHYPATDIPEPARQLFQRNWVRHIPDIRYAPAALVPVRHPVSDRPLDMSSCVLRSVSPYHIEYLQNMGVVASLTISLVEDKRLWGLIACHHYSPRLVDYATRKTCELIGQFASMELIHKQEQDLHTYQMQVKAIQDDLQRAFLREPNFIEQVLTRNHQSLMNLVHAQGTAILLDGTLTLLGQTPAAEDVYQLVDWLKQNNSAQQSQEDRVFATDTLSQVYPPAQQFTDTASGLLGISILLSQVKQKSYHILWFRPEQIQTVEWAGKPQDSITIDEIGKMHLCPRKSFEIWKETVRGKSTAWHVTELEAAIEMRNTLMLAVLEFSQVALEQAAERAAIANRAKSQFLAKMSHELRTPLNAILGFAQVMHRSPNTPPEFQEHLGIINRSGEHLLSLINDVLEMSRIEAGQLVLTERHFNLHRLLRSLQEMFELKAAQKGLTLVFEEAPGVPTYVCSDEAKLRQILINLIGNAIKFTSQGEVTVRISATPVSSSKIGCSCYPTKNLPCQGLQLVFAVQDTGCGIDPSEWDTIFEAFMQTAEGRHAEGTGLGLCISRQFARLLGGDITVQSGVNQGSTFLCWVVLHRPNDLALLPPEITHLVVGIEPGQPTYRILVAEDAIENRQLLVTLLESIGFEVKTVTTGVEAIEQWQVWQPHVILMDIQMPKMNGYEATRRIRTQEASHRPFTSDNLAQSSPTEPPHIPQPTKIIALTAYAFETDRLASLQAGCDAHITKPFNETTLFETIARLIGVRYHYSKPTSEHPTWSDVKPLKPQDLHVMPTDWRTQVHEAALDLKDEQLRQLITQIPPHEAGLIEKLTALVDNFQLEAIATLTEA